VTPEQERWAEQLLAAAKTKMDLPALAGKGFPPLKQCASGDRGRFSAASRSVALHKPPPVDALVPFVHADSNLLLMDETSLENTFTCQPQQRNVHGRVFGGFLMRCVALGSS
jgi:acyl-coenzyme A thioesterase 9